MPEEGDFVYNVIVVIIVALIVKVDLIQPDKVIHSELVNEFGPILVIRVVIVGEQAREQFLFLETLFDSFAQLVQLLFGHLLDRRVTSVHVNFRVVARWFKLGAIGSFGPRVAKPIACKEVNL